MIFVTGDTHGSYKRLRAFFRDKPVSRKDTLVILGDTGLNYFGDERDKPHRDSAAKLPLTLLCLRGNHDRRPESLPDYEEERRFGGTVYADKAYPHLLFAQEGGFYELEGLSVLTVGGAYSVDKDWRLTHGYNWFPDEQMDEQDMRNIEAWLDARDWRADIVLTHTCPLRYEPAEALFESVDQSRVDKRMERWLDSLERRLSYDRWFCSHYHIDKQDGPVRFLYRDVLQL